MFCESIWCPGHPDEITVATWRRPTLLLSVRDMRNQVYRLESVGVIEMDQAFRSFSQIPFFPVSFPLCDRVLDYVRSALTFLGYVVSDAIGFTAGWCRSISSNVTEFAFFRPN